MTTKSIKKLGAIALSVATTTWLTGAAFVVPVAMAQSTDLQAQINALLAQIQVLQAQLAAQTGTTSTATTCSFTRNLTVGSTGDDVKCLQQYLNGAGHQVSATGAGSPGSESTYFGSLTRAALAKWQAANAVSPAVGYWGPISRAKFASLAEIVIVTPPTDTPPTDTPPTDTPPTTGTGLMVSLAANQPAAGLFGESFASRPFTKLVFTAAADGDVTVTALKVQRTGQANDAVFSGVVALDDAGVRLGGSKTFGADHTLRLTDSFVVKAGQSRTITLAGDSDNNQDDYAGQLASLSLIAVETNGATVNAGFPLVGNEMTINSTLAVGTMTLARGSFDPASAQTKEIGTMGYTFSSLRLTSGSAEDTLVKSIRWNQSGSAGVADLGNVKVVFDGTTYDATISSDGKYFTAVFGDGVTITKGFNKEMYIKGDILDGSARTVDFDLYRYADLQVVGLTYGYGILPSATETTADNDDDGEFQDGEPRYDAYTATIGAGTLQVTGSNAVPAQNIAINSANQPLGAFTVIVKGEPVSVAQMIFRFSVWNGTGDPNASTQDITNVTFTDANGSVVAGPVDIAASSPNVTFTDTVTFPVGTNTYILKGKLSTGYATDNTVAASTTPSGWTTPRGTVSGVTITPTPSSALTGATMTVKGGALRVSTLATPTAQTIVAGLRGFTFSKLSFDTTASGEDIRLNATQVEFNFGQAASADDLTNCQLWNVATALNTGSNVVNGANGDATGADKTFTFDQSLILPKGTITTLDLKCDTSATTTTTISSYNYTLDIPGDADDMAPTGVLSGQTITETYNDVEGQVITLTNGGSLTVALDSSSPGITLANANTTGNVLGVLRFTATNESIEVKQLGLVLGGTSSNTPEDLANVTLWDGDNRVDKGGITFSGDNATTTLEGFVVPKNTDKTLTIKGDIASIGTDGAAKPGHRIRVEYDGNAGDGNNATRGTGQSSGTTIYATGSTTSSNGVIVHRSVPTLAKLPLPSNTYVDGTRSLYRFSVTAPSTGAVGLYKFTFTVATSGGTTVSSHRIYNFRLDGYTTSSFSNTAYNSPLNSISMNADGWGTTSDLIEVYFDPTGTPGTKTAIQVPAGTTRYFELKGTVTGKTATTTASIQLEGDALPTDGTNVGPNTADNFTGSSGGVYAFATTAANADTGTATDDFIWSGNSTTTSEVQHYDWTNGYRVSGLPSTNMSSETLSP